MVIKRNFENGCLSISLTKNELSEAYNEYQNILDMEVVEQEIKEQLITENDLTKKRRIAFQFILNNQGILSKIAREYRFGIDNHGWNEKYALHDALINFTSRLEERINAKD